MWAAPGENTPKIRWHKRRKKFTVDTFWFVLEPLARTDPRADIRLSAIFEPTSGSRERCTRRRAHPVVVLGPHLRIFQLSFPHRRGSACPGLSCMRRHTRPAGKSRKNSRLPFTYREYTDTSVVAILAVSSFLPHFRFPCGDQLYSIDRQTRRE